VHGAIVRIEASSDNLYASIDALVEKLERSLTKHKTKLLHRAKSGRSARGESIRRTGDDLDAVAEDEQDDELDNIFTIYDGEDPEDIKDLKAASTLSQASV
jgi:putative sigma-54 modulation protein